MKWHLGIFKNRPNLHRKLPLANVATIQAGSTLLPLGYALHSLATWADRAIRPQSLLDIGVCRGFVRELLE